MGIMDGNSSSGTSPSYHYDTATFRTLDVGQQTMVGYPAQAGFLNPYSAVFNNQDFSLAHGQSMTASAPQYFYAPAGVALPMSFAATPSNQQMYFSTATMLQSQNPTNQSMSWASTQLPMDDLSPEKYKQVIARDFGFWDLSLTSPRRPKLASELIAQDDGRTTPSPNPEQMYQGMQTTRPTPSSSTITSSFFEEFEAPQQTTQLYRAGSGSASSSAATSYMQSNYEFNFTYDQPATDTVPRESSQDPLHADRTGFSDDGGSMEGIEEDPLADLPGNEANDDDDDAYVDPSSRRGGCLARFLPFS
jgi:hypothetical protein